jgi:hypothetical protein
MDKAYIKGVQIADETILAEADSQTFGIRGLPADPLHKKLRMQTDVHGSSLLDPRYNYWVNSNFETIILLPPSYR